MRALIRRASIAPLTVALAACTHAPANERLASNARAELLAADSSLGRAQPQASLIDKLAGAFSDDVTNCSYALTACRYRTPPSDKPLYYVWRRATEPTNSPWELDGEMCGTEAAPAEAPKPPPVPLDRFEQFLA